MEAIAPNKTQRPQALGVKPENIPVELKAIDQWVVWRYEFNQGRKRWTKIPYRVNDAKASSTDPDTWTSFDEALARYERRAIFGENYDGIGFVLTQACGIVGIDLDHCENEEWATDIIDRFATYAEFSPSGEGIRIFTKGSLPDTGKKKGNIEIYAAGRYLTVTGQKFFGVPATIEPRQEVVEWLLKTYFTEKPKPKPQPKTNGHDLNDQELLDRAFAAKNGDKLRALFNGNSAGHPSQSEADLALCGLLAFWTQDTGQIDRLFRSSALYRDKWDEKHGATTYGERTIQAALERCTEHYQPTIFSIPRGNGQTKDAKIGSNVILVDASTVKTKKVRWLWQGRIPFGKVTVLDGDPGLGKSLISIDIAARASAGQPMPNADGALLEATGIVFMSAEDDPEDTIVPRLALAGADLTRIRLFQGIQQEDSTILLPTVKDLDAIRTGIKAVDAQLVIIDPLMAYLPEETNSHRDQDVRRSLAPVADLARETGVAILVIRHLNKAGGNNNPVYRGGGSIGIIGAARSGLMVIQDPDEEFKYILCASKINLAKRSVSLAYEIQSNAEDLPWINWLGPTDKMASSLLEDQGKSEEERGAIREAEEFLSEYLKHLPRKAADVVKASHAAGISEKTLRRAKVKLAIWSGKSDFNSDWYWGLQSQSKDLLTKMANQHEDGQHENL